MLNKYKKIFITVIVKYIFPLFYDFVCSIERLADTRNRLQEVKCEGI